MEKTLKNRAKNRRAPSFVSNSFVGVFEVGFENWDMKLHWDMKLQGNSQVFFFQLLKINEIW